MSDETFPVIELFGPTIQGEGKMVGSQTHFIRFGGCPLRCVWCDSMYAVDPKQVHENRTLMDEMQIVAAIKELPSAPWVTLTGGEPAMWSLGMLARLLNVEGLKVAVESSGTLKCDWIHHCDLFTVSPKGPSSGMLEYLDWDLLNTYANARNTVAKVVIFDRHDLEFAIKIASLWGPTRTYLSVGTLKTSAGSDNQAIDILSAYKALVEEVLKRPDLAGVSVLPQLHVLLWGQQRGV